MAISRIRNILPIERISFYTDGLYIVIANIYYSYLEDMSDKVYTRGLCGRS